MVGHESRLTVSSSLGDERREGCDLAEGFHCGPIEPTGEDQGALHCPLYADGDGHVCVIAEGLSVTYGNTTGYLTRQIQR